MPCDDIRGDWIRGLLADDSTEDAMIDPPLTISNPSGSQFRGRFLVAGEVEFDITCNGNGARPRIEFRRVHTDGTITDYSGKVVPFGPRAAFGIIKGRFRRVTVVQSRTLVATGDWETEKPT